MLGMRVRGRSRRRGRGARRRRRRAARAPGTRSSCSTATSGRTSRTGSPARSRPARPTRGSSSAGPGTGTAMAANKVPGVRAALAWDPWIAEGARRWNDANVLVMSLKRTTPETAREIVAAWLVGRGAGRGRAREHREAGDAVIVATDWVTISALATAFGTLVLARRDLPWRCGRRTARRASRSARCSPGSGRCSCTSRLDDPMQKIFFADQRYRPGRGRTRGLRDRRRRDPDGDVAAERRRGGRASARLAVLSGAAPGNRPGAAGHSSRSRRPDPRHLRPRARPRLLAGRRSATLPRPSSPERRRRSRRTSR